MLSINRPISRQTNECSTQIVEGTVRVNPMFPLTGLLQLDIIRGSVGLVRVVKDRSSRLIPFSGGGHNQFVAIFPSAALG